MASIILVNGRPLGVPGKVLTAVPATVQQTPLTALTLVDFYLGHSLARAVVQRKAGTYDDTRPGTADVQVVFNYAGGNPAGVQARVVNIDNPAQVIMPWSNLVKLKSNGSVGIGTLENVPVGMGYAWEIRDSYQPVGATLAVNAGANSHRWGVGVVGKAAGQSNMVFGTLGAGGAFDITPNTGGLKEVEYFASHKAMAFFGTDGYVACGAIGGTGSTATGSEAGTSQGGSLAFVRVLAMGLKKKYGIDVPVCLIPWAQSNKSINYFLPGQTGYDQMFTVGGAGAGKYNLASALVAPNVYPGDLEFVIWHQGEADGTMDRPTYLGKLKTLYGKYLEYVAQFGRTAQHLHFLPAMLGVYSNTAMVEEKRGAVLDLERDAPALGWPKVRPGWNCIDLDTSDPAPRVDGQPVDGLHMVDRVNGMQYARMSRCRATQAVLYATGCSSYSALGPRIDKANITRNNLVATIPVVPDVPGAPVALTTRKATAITGWSWKDKNGADIANVPVAIASPMTLSATFPVGTLFPVTGKHCGGMRPDSSNPVVDSLPYPFIDDGTGKNMLSSVNPNAGTNGLDVFLDGRPVLETPDPFTVN